MFNSVQALGFFKAMYTLNNQGQNNWIDRWFELTVPFPDFDVIYWFSSVSITLVIFFTFVTN